MQGPKPIVANFKTIKPSGKRNNSKGGVLLSEVEKDNNAFSLLLEKEVIETRSASKEDGLSLVDELLSGLEIVENDLKENPSLAMFENYKNVIKKLSSEILHKSVKLHVFKHKKKSMQVIKIINQTLMDIHKNLTTRNKDVVKVLRQMGEIRGLILNELG